MSVRQALCGHSAAREIELIAFDALLLAIHEVDVVAQEQVQVLHIVARQFLFNRVELQQQVVTERAHQREPRGQRMLEFLLQGAHHGERRRLFAALLFGEQRGQRLKLTE